MALLLVMLVCCFACQQTVELEDDETKKAVTNESGKSLPFGKENYQKDFTVLYYAGSIYKNFYFDDVTEAGEIISKALFERKVLVQDYLGVNVKGVAESSSESSIQTALTRDSMSGMDTYQLALTHSYIGLGAMVSQGCLTDMYELENMSFNEDYYNVNVIEGLEIGGKAYYGSSDFMISDVCAIFFNKDMYSTYQYTENFYDLVRNGEWTLEKFKQMCANNVAENTGDPAWTKEDTYGLGVRADWEFIPLVESCGIEWLVGQGYKTLNMGASNERYLSLYEWCEDVADAEWSYMYNWGDAYKVDKVTIADGRFMFTMEAVKYAHDHLASDVKFGILPYPKFDTDQKEYRTLDAAGVFCVPVTITDDEMVGKVIECLSFYSADTINIAYYERLLGTRVSDAPDDAEMLDKYIFGNIVSSPAYNYSEKANMPLGILVYTIPKMLRAKLNGDTINTIATNWASNRIAAQAVIDSTINR